MNEPNIMKYKIGQLVVCIDPVGELAFGERYVVKACSQFNGDIVWTVEDAHREQHHTTDRFILLDEFEKVRGWYQVPVETASEEPVEPQFNDVTSPEHYASGGIEPMDFYRANFTDEEFIGAMKFNVIKYVHRHTLKGTPVKDLKKAKQYLEWLIEWEEEHE